MDLEARSQGISQSQSSLVTNTISTPIVQIIKPRSIAPSRQATESISGSSKELTRIGGALRPRPRKSRNGQYSATVDSFLAGCATCKIRRLKCDETKPTCLQCERRNVECEGYQKDFKWRSFKDTTKQIIPATERRPQIPPHQNFVQAAECINVATGPILLQSTERSVQPALNSSPTSSATPGILSRQPQNSFNGPSDRNELAQLNPLPVPDPGTDIYHDLIAIDQTIFDGSKATRDQNSRRSHRSAVSPAISIVSESNLRNDLVSESFYVDLYTGCEPGLDENGLDIINYFEVDSASGDNNGDNQATIVSNIYDRCGDLQDFSTNDFHSMTFLSSPSISSLLNAPTVDPGSPEMLISRFDKETCGILSIRDGPTENPWRTIMLPLAATTPPLHYVILALAAFHGAATLPRLKLTGMAYMAKSISTLLTEMDKMSLYQNLASSLALAIAEGWADRKSTGMRHLKGAKTFLDKALVQQRKNTQLRQQEDEDATNLKFFLNTYLYLDAMSHLTSIEEYSIIDLEDIIHVVTDAISNEEHEIDPLMGCASTLFPLLGKVGTLIQEIRKLSSVSLSIVSEATELREQLLQWEPPDKDTFEQPEDPSTSIRHALQTAEAFRRALLLYLHQAVTELASEPSYEQGKAILTLIAATPPSSRVMIIQVFPLLIASCEMINLEDRNWVTERWDAMQKKLSIPKTKLCWKIVKEVWGRRDQWATALAQRISRTDSRNISLSQFVNRPVEELIMMARTLGQDKPSLNSQQEEDDDDIPDDYHARNNTGRPTTFRPSIRSPVRLPRRHRDVSLLSGEIDFTVRGHLNWLGVMSDWGWEFAL